MFSFVSTLIMFFVPLCWSPPNLACLRKLVAFEGRWRDYPKTKPDPFAFLGAGHHPFQFAGDPRTAEVVTGRTPKLRTLRVDLRLAALDAQHRCLARYLDERHRAVTSHKLWHHAIPLLDRAHEDDGIAVLA